MVIVIVIVIVMLIELVIVIVIVAVIILAWNRLAASAILRDASARTAQKSVHPVSVRRFPSFRTQPLENLSHYL